MRSCRKAFVALRPRLSVEPNSAASDSGLPLFGARRVSLPVVRAEWLSLSLSVAGATLAIGGEFPTRGCLKEVSTRAKQATEKKPKRKSVGIIKAVETL
jgi:hypothetical protein